MSRENVELVTRAIRAAAARPKPDFETMNALFHPDHVLVPLTSQIDVKEVRGGRGYQTFLREPPVSWNADLEGAVDVGGNKVLCVLSARYRGSTSGAEVEQRTWVVATVRDGRVSRTEVYTNPAEALEAAGLRE
jgi:ketosteroid isomerase-like protein